MHKGICLGLVPGSSIGEKYANAAKLGFVSVEPATLRTPEEREQHRECAEKNGIAVSSIMNSDHWGSPLSHPDPDVRKKSIDGIAQSIESAVVLGADTVLVVPAVVNAEVTYEEAWERSYTSLQEILPLAREKGVYLAVENVWNKFLLSPIEFADYIDGFEDEYLAAYFDVGNIVAYGFPQHWIRTLGRRLKKIHIKGFDAAKHAWVQLLAGSIDWAAVMKALHDVGYDDAITAELNGEGDDKMAGIAKISADMDNIFAMG